MARSSSTWTKETVPKSPGAPKGSRLPAEVLQLRNEAKAEVVRSIASGLLMTIGELQELVQRANGHKDNPHFDPTTPVVDVLVASVLSQAIKHGDMSRFTYMANFILGKPKPVEHGSDELLDHANPANTLKQIPSSILIDAIRRKANETAGHGGPPENQAPDAG